MRGTWQTTDSGGGVGAALGVIVLAAAIAGPVAAAVGELLRAVLIAAAVIFGLGVIAGAALLAYRVRHRRPALAVPAHRARVLPRAAAESLQEPQRPAIEAAREVHLHLHGVTAEDVSAILARVNREDR